MDITIHSGAGKKTLSALQIREMGFNCAAISLPGCERVIPVDNIADIMLGLNGFVGVRDEQGRSPIFGQNVFWANRELNPITKIVDNQPPKKISLSVTQGINKIAPPDGWSEGSIAEHLDPLPGSPPLGPTDDLLRRGSSLCSRVIDLVHKRGESYGTPSQNHGVTAALVSTWLSARLGRPTKITPEDICMINIIQKVARLGHGTHDDSLVDIAGYAENIWMLEEKQRNKSPNKKDIQ